MNQTSSLAPALLSCLLATACDEEQTDDGSASIDPGDPEWSHTRCDERLAYPVAPQNEDPGEIEVVTFGDGARDVQMPAGVTEAELEALTRWIDAMEPTP